MLISCALTAALAASVLVAPGGNTTTTVQAATASDTALTTAPSRVSVHDPSITVSEDGTYYVFGSHIAAAKSTDMINWTTFTNGYAKTNNTLFGNLSENLKVPFSWAGENDRDSAGTFAVWAPDVYYNKDYVNTDGSKGAYMMYFCTSSTSIRSAIAFAVSQNIEGPYTYVDTLVYSGFTKTSKTDSDSKINTWYKNTNIQSLIDDGTLQDGVNENWFNSLSGGYNNKYAPNAIDPTILEDKDGKLWMTYGSWSGGIFILEIDPTTGKAIYPGKNSSEDESTVVDEYFGKRIAGGNGNSGEGPFILYDEASDYYYLYVSYNGFLTNGGYNMRLFRSKNPDGPYTDAAGNDAVMTSSSVSHEKVGIKVMGNYKFPCMGYQITSPGHNSALVDSDGERYLVYHTRFGGTTHQVRVHQQFINEEGWPVTAVYENKGDKISETGYSKEEIVGDYNFINHGTAIQKGGYTKPSNLVLTADGKVSGAATGTWEEKENTYYAKFVLGGVTYSGVFFKQHTETTSPSASKNVMTFTAIGTNNETIWGSKKGVSVSSSRSTIYAGGDQDNTAQLTVNGSSAVSYTISYKSSKTDVASVNAEGLVTAKKAGTTTITATYKAGTTTKTFTKKITVKKAYLKFSKSKATLKKGKSSTFKVKGYGLKASSIKWTSSKKKVATVGSKNGVVKAVKAGTTVITASYKKFKVTKKVKVKAK
jgi:arabinan endo-1,5-alpha-L-arabinosidase